MSRFLIFFTIIVCIPGCLEAQVSPMEKGDIIIMDAKGNPHMFSVELAVDFLQHRQGLMHRTELAPDAGMLFLFGAERPVSFWMKDTLIPLDIIFVRKDGRIHHIHHSAKPMDESRITAKDPTFAVLEINGGISDLHSIKAGDIVYHPAFKNTHLLKASMNDGRQDKE